MAKLVNPSLRPVPLPTGHIVPRQGELVTTNAVLRCADNAAFLNGQIRSGALIAEYDPDPAEDAASDPVPAPPAGPAVPPEAPEKGKNTKG